MNDEADAPGVSLSGAVPARRVVEHLMGISPVMQHWGIELIEAERGATRMGMTIRKDMANTHGACHGGVLFTLADTCYGFAANSHNDRAVAASCDVRFLKPAKAGDRLIAQSREIWKHGRSGLYDVTITNQDGETVLLMRGHARLIGGRHIEEG